VSSLEQYRAAIGHFNAVCCAKKFKGTRLLKTGLLLRVGLLLSPMRPCNFLIICLLLMMAGDVHLNPGPNTPTTHKDKQLTVCHINCRSLTSSGQVDSLRASKFDEIDHLIQNLLCDVVCLTETWLDATILDVHLNIPGFKLYRRDRNRHGGGVGVYVRDTIPTHRRVDIEAGTSECTWVECTVNSKRCLLAVYYRPPGQRAQEVSKFLEDMQESITLALNSNPDTLLILGDFNDKCIEWESSHRESELKLRLYDLLNVNNLFQMVHEPTRIT
jgi:hypothetical protein